MAVDGCLAKAPAGGRGVEDVGPNPTDRAKRGWKRSLATDARGIPLGFVAAAANVHDHRLLGATLDALAPWDLPAEGTVVHLDAGYDCAPARTALRAAGVEAEVAPRRRRSRRRAGGRDHPRPGRRLAVPLGRRWVVERAHAWLNAFGQLRRSTDRRTAHRLAWLALACALVVTVKLVDWARRWNAY